MLSAGLFTPFPRGLRVWYHRIAEMSDTLSYVASLPNQLKIYRNQVCVKEIQI